MTWLLPAVAILVVMWADLVAERTLFSNQMQLFVSLFTLAWSISAASFMTYPILRRYALLQQRTRDEGDERNQVEASLRGLQEALEQRVQDRTTALMQLNQKLEAEIALREHAEQTRMELLQQLLRVQEEERHRIARELHDQMGQYLAGLNFGLEVLKHSVDRKAAIQPLQELVRQIGHEVHDLALRLRPPSLDDMGLHATLVNYIAEWSEHSRVKADFQSLGLEARRLPSHLETTVFRIVQEALTNVLKHAQANHVSLVIRRDNREVVAVVEDDGSGFDPEIVMNGPPIHQQLGLLGIKERVNLMGGRLTIESRCGAGTTLLIRLPVPEEKITHDHA